MNQKNLIKFYTIAVGSMDTLTGILLLTMPLVTLRLMGINPAGQLENPVFLQFIGGFVGATGSTYFLGLLFSRMWRSPLPLRMVWISTAWVRLIIGIFSGVAVFSGMLQLPWVSVPLTDLSCAIFQFIVLMKFWKFES